jgi:hypothetical protein
MLFFNMVCLTVASSSPSVLALFLLHFSLRCSFVDSVVFPSTWWRPISHDDETTPAAPSHPQARPPSLRTYPSPPSPRVHAPVTFPPSLHAQTHHSIGSAPQPHRTSHQTSHRTSHQTSRPVWQGISKGVVRRPRDTFPVGGHP